MQQNYSSNERYFVLFLAVLSLSSFYPVIYILAKVHKKKGFEIVFCFASVLTMIIYKINQIFDTSDFFLPQDSWHKLSNITLLTIFCSLIIYLARIPKYLGGYLVATGMCLIILMQEKDSFTFKYALVPLIFNNMLMIFSACFMQQPLYVNSRMVTFGLIWYVISILAFFGAYHKLLDFYQIFDDLFLFSTGLSLFYSWQTYEKHDITFNKFLNEQLDIVNQIHQLLDKVQNEQDKENLKHNEQKSLRKKAKKKEIKKQKLQQQKKEEEERSSLLESSISTRYRDDVSRSEIMNFCNRIVATKAAKETPIICLDGVSFIHTTQNDITLVATSKGNINAALIMQFLYSLVTLCKAYFNGEFNENQVRKNFALIYELLDEVMDFGYPQILDPDLLKMYITQGKAQQQSLNNIEKLKQITIQATGTISWRAEGLRYKKNEVFIDIIENVNVLLSNRGTVLRADVLGQVVMKTQLSGMPECKFGINDKLLIKNSQANPVKQDRGIQIDDIKFHQCVRLGKFDRDRSITFIPPDGVFDLMTYRISENINLPFKVVPVIQEYPESNRIEYSVKVKAIFERSNFATNVVVKIPVPPNTAKEKIYNSAHGKAKYEPDQNAIVWRIKKFQGDNEYLMSAEVSLTTLKLEKAWNRPPISLDFQVPMFTGSGLRVRYLRIQDKSGYKPTKWIRYITKAGDYQHRI